MAVYSDGGDMKIVAQEFYDDKEQADEAAAKLREKYKKVNVLFCGTYLVEAYDDDVPVSE